MGEGRSSVAEGVLCMLDALGSIFHRLLKGLGEDCLPQGLVEPLPARAYSAGRNGPMLSSAYVKKAFAPSPTVTSQWTDTCPLAASSTHETK